MGWKRLAVLLTVVGQSLDDLSHCGSFLADGNVDTVQFLLLICTVVKSLLIDDGIDSDSGFTTRQQSKRLLF